MYEIPQDKLLLLLRHSSFNNSFRIEVYNMPWRKPKKLEEARLDNGTILFIEEGE